MASTELIPMDERPPLEGEYHTFSDGFVERMRDIFVNYYIAPQSEEKQTKKIEWEKPTNPEYIYQVIFTRKYFAVTSYDGTYKCDFTGYICRRWEDCQKDQEKFARAVVEQVAEWAPIELNDELIRDMTHMFVYRSHPEVGFGITLAQVDAPEIQIYQGYEDVFLLFVDGDGVDHSDGSENKGRPTSIPTEYEGPTDPLRFEVYPG